MTHDVEFVKYLETVLPEFLCIKSQHKNVLKEGGMFAPSVFVDIDLPKPKGTGINLIVINYTVVDKGGYHNSFGRFLVTGDQNYINKLYSDFLTERRNNKIDIISNF
jgi:hypothetical protein